LEVDSVVAIDSVIGVHVVADKIAATAAATAAILVDKALPTAPVPLRGREHFSRDWANARCGDEFRRI
jgi:hypothetical protein